MENKFEVLFRSIKIGASEIKNRIVMAPMVTNYCDSDGVVTERFKAYLAARAKGGVGLIIVEAAYVQPGGRGFSNQIGIYKDELIEGLRDLVDLIHQCGTKIAIQLFHCGRQGHSSVTGAPLIAPSPLPCPVCREMPLEMTLKDINDTVEAFGRGAHRAKEAGFDFIEIHGAHGYLINEFLSPYSNRRSDEYGGSFENRTKFPLEVVQRVRKEVGKNFPLIYRISSAEFVPGGLTIEDTKSFALLLVENGIDAVDVSGGVFESSEMIIQPADMPQGIFADNASSIRAAIGARVPVIVAGNIKDPYKATEILDEGKADMIALGRAFLADADFPIKIMTGKEKEIRICKGCNEGCTGRLFEDKAIFCVINPPPDEPE